MEATMDYKGLAEELVNKCLKKGADAAEAYIENGRNLSIEVRKGEVETVQEAASYGAGLRVFIRGKMAFSSSKDLGERALEDAVGRAIEFARITTSDPNNVLPDDKGMTEIAGLYDPGIARVPMEEKINLAKKTEQLALKDPRVTKSDGARYGEAEGEVVIANSNGLAKGYGPACSLCFGGGGKGEQRSSGVVWARFYGDLPAEAVALGGAGCLRDAGSQAGQDAEGGRHFPRRCGLRSSGRNPGCG
jgi:PmbA protein